MRATAGLGALGTVVACMVALTACGDAGGGNGAGLREPLGDNAGLLDGVSYRVVRFRRLDLRDGLDRKLIGTDRDGSGRDVYAAFLQACNEADEATRSARRARLLTAADSEAEPVPAPDDNPFAYRPIELQPGQCLPARSSPAAPLSGRVLSFRVPRGQLGPRPRLELRQSGERLVLQLPG